MRRSAFGHNRWGNKSAGSDFAGIPAWSAAGPVCRWPWPLPGCWSFAHSSPDKSFWPLWHGAGLSPAPCCFFPALLWPPAGPSWLPAGQRPRFSPGSPAASAGSFAGYLRLSTCISFFLPDQQQMPCFPPISSKARRPAEPAACIYPVHKRHRKDRPGFH